QLFLDSGGRCHGAQRHRRPGCSHDGVEIDFRFFACLGHRLAPRFLGCSLPPMRKRSNRTGKLDSLLKEMKTSDAAIEITRASKSNLAFAFIAMSGARRRDITTFYAFCRVIDDIADDDRREQETKRRELAMWRQSLRGEFANEPALAKSVRQLLSTYPITPEMLEEIITGVEMDVDIRRYATWDELRVYCHRVASAVGLVSIEIFGYKNPQCRDYAIALGLALQMTNIIRDLAADLKSDRIYLPAQDLARFHYSEQDLCNRLADSRFIQLMNFEAARAEDFFVDAS